MNTIRRFALAALLLPASSARAVVTQVSQGQAYGSTPVNTGDPVMTFNKFNGPGQLVQVDVSFDGGVIANGEATAWGGPFTVTVDLLGFAIQGGIGTPPIIGAVSPIATPVELGSHTFTGFENPALYGPFSASGLYQQSFTSPATFAQFVGNGSWSYHVLAAELTTVDAPEAFPATTTMTSLGRMVLTYHVSIPEPASLMLLTIALISVGSVARTRQPIE